MLSRIVSGHNHKRSIGILRHIRKSVLIRRINALRLCTAVGGQQFRKESKKFQTRIIFERYLLFLFHCCLLSCRYVMLQKIIWVNQNGGHKQSLGGHSLPAPPPVATARASANSKLKHKLVSYNLKFR